MDVKGLVSEVLKQIAQGINLAQGVDQDEQPIVVPKYVAPHPKGGTYDQTTKRVVNLVNFDLQFSVESSETSATEQGGKGEVKISVLNANMGKNSNSAKSKSKTHIQSVSFNVPVLWPSHDGTEQPPKKEKIILSELQKKNRESVV